MKIILIKPYYPFPYTHGDHTYNRFWPPLSLANCAALLEKEGYQVSILDAHAMRIKPERIGSFITNYDKIFITSTSLDRWQCPNIDTTTLIETTNYIQQLSRDFYVLGYHGTIAPKKILELTKAQAIITGAPEYTILEICQNKDLHNINGLAFKNNEELVTTPARATLDLKSLPTPAYHLLNTQNYYYEIMGKNFALFEISRGCGFTCKFCNKIMYGKQPTTKSAEQVLKELQYAIEKNNVRTGYFIDLEFLSNKELVNQICDFLLEKQYKFTWCCQTRPDSIDIEILIKMKSAGCQLIHLGIESGLQKYLDYLGKNITIEHIVNSVKWCKQAKIKTLAFYLFGLPDETAKDRDSIFNFAKKLNTDYVSFHKIFFYQGSNMGKKPLNINGDIDKFIRKAFIKYYLRPACLYKLNISAATGGYRLLWNRIKSLK